MRWILKGSPEKVSAEWDDRAEFGNHEAHANFLSQVGFPDVPCSVLEIGSGKGAILAELAARGHAVVGIDVDWSLLVEAGSRGAGAIVCRASGEALPFDDGAFDFVLSFDVFEHIPDTEGHLREVWRVLRPAGSYLLQTPNKWTNVLFEPIRFAQKFGVRHAFRFREDHCSLHSYRQLRRALEGAGFDAVFREVPVVNEFFERKVRRYLGPLGLLALRVLDADRAPMPLRTNFYVVARKPARTGGR